MLSEKDFKDTKIIQASDFNDALNKCAKIRSQGNNERITIQLDSSLSSGQFRFPFSDFYIKGKEKTKITGSLYGKAKDEYGKGLTTWKTATLTILGSNNLFSSLKIENTAMDPKNKGTSVALSLFGNNNAFINCSIDSTQDTLFLGPLPDDLATRYQGFIPKEETEIEGNLINYFNQCHISGSVDFIFGAGQGLFNNCEIESVEDGRMGVSYVTAPAHSLKDPLGFVFSKCHFVSSSLFCQRVYLSRPWRDYGKCVFIKCEYGKHIKDEGFIDWTPTAFRYLTARYEEYPLKNGRIPWMHNKESKVSSVYQDLINNNI